MSPHLKSELLSPIDKKLFFSKNDPKDIRFGDLANTNDFKNSYQVGLLGYPDDRGVLNNGGRVGTSAGPDAIRSFFYKMTPPPFFSNIEYQTELNLDFQNLSFIDYGNLNLANTILESHSLAHNAAFQSLSDTRKTITLGGGHDYAFPDGMAFLKFCQNKKTKTPLIINFDAHLDVRPLTDKPTSGTPFFRLLEDSLPFHLIQVGIQEFCNSKNHFEYCKARNVNVVTQNKVLLSNGTLLDELRPILSKYIDSPLFISVDIDGFSSSFAPGCSQSWPTGFTPESFFPVFEYLIKTFKTPLLGIYEVSPQHDLQNVTSKLAAQIMYSFVSHN